MKPLSLQTLVFALIPEMQVILEYTLFSQRFLKDRNKRSWKFSTISFLLMKIRTRLTETIPHGRASTDLLF